MGTIEVTCAKCGKEFALDEKWKGFADKYPERLTCSNCKDGAKKDVATAYKSTAKPASYKAKANVHKQSSALSGANAEMFRKAYDELTAEFSDILPEVKEYLGGWTSTIVINRSRPLNLLT